MPEQDAIKLTGFHMGQGHHPECWRLYPTQEMTRYCEFLKKDVMFSERLPNGHVVTWLRADAQLKAAAAAPADFLEGELLANLDRVSTGDTIRRLLDVGFLCGSEKVKQISATFITSGCNTSPSTEGTTCGCTKKPDCVNDPANTPQDKNKKSIDIC